MIPPEPELPLEGAELTGEGWFELTFRAELSIPDDRSFTYCHLLGYTHEL